MLPDEDDEKPQLVLGAFDDAFLNGRDDLKPNTRIAFIQSRKPLVRFFGEDKPIDAINAGDADEWAATLRKDYAPATVATFVKKARPRRSQTPSHGKPVRFGARALPGQQGA